MYVESNHHSKYPGTCVWGQDYTPSLSFIYVQWGLMKYEVIPLYMHMFKITQCTSAMALWKAKTCLMIIWTYSCCICNHIINSTIFHKKLMKLCRVSYRSFCLGGERINHVRYTVPWGLRGWSPGIFLI